MKALSIKQPWAWAILNGKPVENRSWHTNFRGEFLVHTGKGFDNDGYGWLIEQALCNEKFSLKIDDIPKKIEFPLGGIVGKGVITDCVSWHPSPYFFGPWGFVIENPEPIQFIPLKGQLGFFEVEI